MFVLRPDIVVDNDIVIDTKWKTLQRLPAPGVYRRWHITGTSVAFDIATVDIGQPQSVPTTVREIIDGPEPVRNDSQVERKLIRR